MKTAECGFSDPNRLSGDGPIILVDIGFDPTWRVGMPRRLPVPADRDVAALIDTGAQECFIDCDLAGHLHLPVVDRREVAGGLGKQEVDVYLAQIYIPALDLIQYGEFAGVYLHQGGLNFEVLMGRTFLAKFILMYNGPSGRVTLTG
jgi:predicted aspartyl protease